MKDKTSVVMGVGLAAFVVGMLLRYVFVKREGFFQQDIGAPVTGGEDGVYSGIDISNGNSWSPANAPTPLKPYEAADDSQLFAFQNSEFKPECCPSSIMNDVGCLCLTDKEEKELAYRGGNRVSL
ncbi:hypothetical protein EB118_05275 [bacterium]|nr:hypothetical protein [bacterium]